jgi:hypothetical protein
MGIESEIMLMAHRQAIAGDFGGTIKWGDVAHPATIGAFDLQQVLNADGGGFSYLTSATVTVAREDLPDTFSMFKRNEIVVCTPNDTTRPARTCRVEKMTDCGALIEVIVVDRNQGA